MFNNVENRVTLDFKPIMPLHLLPMINQVLIQFISGSINSLRYLNPNRSINIYGNILFCKNPIQSANCQNHITDENNIFPMLLLLKHRKIKLIDKDVISNIFWKFNLAYLLDNDFRKNVVIYTNRPICILKINSSLQLGKILRSRRKLDSSAFNFGKYFLQSTLRSKL